LGTRQYKFINQGVAGYESYNVLKKLDKAIRLRPDFVILLVGTNDVLSSLDPGLAKLSRKLKKIPHEPSLLHYSTNISNIIQQLKMSPGLRIAIASLPVVGENLESLENRTISKYNAELKRISDKENVTYLPVHEEQKSFLTQKTVDRGKDYRRSEKLAYSSLFQHYLLLRSFDSISRKNGYLLLTDGIHQNPTGARFIADEIEEFILS
jgi:lysophospholipase L1-like esterase